MCIFREVGFFVVAVSHGGIYQTLLLIRNVAVSPLTKSVLFQSNGVKGASQGVGGGE